MRRLNFNFAFTLAEVLITLGIIGAVAAMTMPSLINHTKDKQYKAAYKKAYSAINQALVYAISDYKMLPINNTSETSTPTSENIGENFKTISGYFKTVKTCFDNNADECWSCEDGQAGALYSSAPDYLGCTKDNYAFVDNSGFAWYLYSNREAPIIVDVNGNRKPNRLGKDRFVLYFSDESKGMFIDEITVIIPQKDYTAKQRWCPSGHCLYTTLLFE